MTYLPRQLKGPTAVTTIGIGMRGHCPSRSAGSFGPGRIDRFNRQFTVGIYANVAPGFSLGQAAADTQKLVESIGLPPGYQIRLSGQVKILEQTTANMVMALLLASIFMYMVLAAQFESLAHPFIIMLTLPLSIPFALLSLIVTGRTLNLFSALGIRHELKIDIDETRDLRVGDAFLLASDGLWGYFEDTEIAAVLDRMPPGEASKQLVKSARERAAGRGDNLSLAIVKLEAPLEVPKFPVPELQAN